MSACQASLDYIHSSALSSPTSRERKLRRLLYDGEGKPRNFVGLHLKGAEGIYTDVDEDDLSRARASSWPRRKQKSKGIDLPPTRY